MCREHIESPKKRKKTIVTLRSSSKKSKGKKNNKIQLKCRLNLLTL